MEVIVRPGTTSGELTAPASKSVMQRACAAIMLCGGETILRNYGRSDDDKAALDILQCMGADVVPLDEYELKITATDIKGCSSLHCGESGLAARMFTPLAGLWGGEVTINGSGSLMERPLDLFDQTLPKLGLSVQSNGGKLPLRINGQLQPADIEIDGALSSQFLTGLLFAYSALNADKVTIGVKDLKSRPYIDLTLKVMADFGMALPENRDYTRFIWRGKGRVPRHSVPAYTIESDWSNAAFLLVAGATAGSITVKGLDLFTAQADRRILEALQDCGCRMSIRPDRIEVNRHRLDPFVFDVADSPDLAPPLVALAASCAGTSVIEGADRLVHKESNRALTLCAAFAQLGIEVSWQDNKLIIRGGKVRGGRVHAANDHRIAMAAAVAALSADDAVTIAGAEAVNKSYPAFYSDLAHIAGGSIQANT